MQVLYKTMPLLAAAFVLAVGRPGAASPLFISDSSGDLSASAKFDVSKNALVVTLNNTSTADVLYPKDVLTALFFEIQGPSLYLTPVSAVLGHGAEVLFGGTDPHDSVGGEWAFTSADFTPLGMSGYGISSAGLGYFGPSDRFPGTNLQGPNDPDGVQYGITSAGDDPATGSSAVAGENALIQDQVVFTLDGLPAGFDPSTQITHVVWQYGTSFSEPRIPTPEPTPLLILGAGLLAGLVQRRRRHRLALMTIPA